MRKQSGKRRILGKVSSMNASGATNSILYHRRHRLPTSVHFSLQRQAGMTPVPAETISFSNPRGQAY